MEIKVKNGLRDFYQGPISFSFDGEGIFYDTGKKVYFQTDTEEKKIVFIEEMEKNGEKNFNVERIENYPEIVKKIMGMVRLIYL